jgi:hypothetical protein
MPVFVEENMSACAVVHELNPAEDAPKPSILWCTFSQSRVQVAPTCANKGS